MTDKLARPKYCRSPIRTKLRAKLLHLPIVVPKNGRDDKDCWAAPVQCLDTGEKMMVHVTWWPIARDLAVRGVGAVIEARGRRRRDRHIFDARILLADPTDARSRELRMTDRPPRPEPEAHSTSLSNENEATEALAEAETDGLRRFLGCP
jgi:hypothetical protein